uniref:F-box protein At5g03100-like n=1 Tax=Erigeron canadensis TaxID=72917 RepID=UPI001CB931A3|nr:F-box protein At5g03100-like [Erigeron canadensis]
MGKGSTSRTETIQQKYTLEKKDDDVVLPTELMHRIQSLLSAKEAGRTCVLSKSWLHAWSTIPSLRFPDDHPVTTDVIYNTIQRRGTKQEGVLRSFPIVYGDYSRYSTFTFSSESDNLLFSCKKLQTIKLKATGGLSQINLGVNLVIKCVSLRVLELTKVNISEDIFNNLLSTCSLLEKLILCFSDDGLKKIKVKNLGCLRQLEITSSREEEDGLLDIDNVPSLGFLYYKRGCIHRLPFTLTDATASSLGRSLTQLHLETVIDKAFFDMISSMFPFLESLELRIEDWAPKRLVITSLSLKRLTLKWLCGDRLVEVYAPNLLSFNYNGFTRLPTLKFPIITPKEIKLSLSLWDSIPFDTSFFLKLREVLSNFSESKFDIHIAIFYLGFDGLLPVSMKDDVVDDLRRQVSVSDANVQHLNLRTFFYDCPWEGTRFFDALFSICHPVYVKVFNTLISHRTVNGMMENNMADLKQVLTKNPASGRWEALTSSRKTSTSLGYDVEFKLDWYSHD